MTNKLKAIYLAKEIPISKIKGNLPYQEFYVGKETAVFKLQNAFLYTYSFGAIVLADANNEQELDVIHHLKKLGLSMKERRFVDEYEVVSDPKIRKFIVTDTKLLVNKLDPKMIKVAAKVLAQSVALESYEDEFDKINRQFNVLNKDLEKDGRLNLSEKDILKLMAKNNGVIEEVVSGIGVLEKPESAWDSHMIDVLHTYLVEEFELKERFQELHSQMDFVQENYKIFLESFHNKHAARLEWIIIILIVVEIFLFIYELFYT